jgi:nicotinate-nucleotide adenylyltransferase
MSVLEKIIFIADYIEPGRDRAPHLDMLRKLAFSDPDKTIYCILEDTLSYLRNSGTCIDAASIETYNYYKNLVNGRKE